MSNAREKAEGFTRQVIGQMLGDDLLVQEGKEMERKAADEDRAEAKPQPREQSGEQSGEQPPTQPSSRQENRKDHHRKDNHKDNR